MKGLYEYSGIAVKIKAMSGRLIKKEAYEEMAELKSVAEVVNYLKRYPSYEKLLSDMNDNIYRTKVEGIIHQSIFKDFYKIYLFSGNSQRKFLDIFYLRYENMVLKRYLRNAFDKRDLKKDTPESIAFLSKRSFWDFSRMDEANNITELIEALKGTAFYPLLKRMEENSEATLFDYENALNLYFIKKMIAGYKKTLKKKDLEAIMQIYSSEIELLNIQWTYRAKKYYQMSPAEIYAFIIPINYKLNIDTMHQIVEAPSIEELKTVLKGCYYARYVDDEMNLPSIERLYQELISKIRSIYMRRYPYSIACIENYLFYKEQEVDNLTTLLEGVKYGISKEEIMGYLI